MGQILFPLIFVFAFLGAVLLVQGGASLFFAGHEKSRRVNRRLTMLESGMGRREVYEALVRRPVSPRFQALALVRMHDRAAEFLRQAALETTPTRLFGYLLGATVALWAVAVVVLRATGRGVGPSEMLLSMLGAAGLSCCFAWSWISGRREKRRKQLEEQLPLALDIIVRALRAGHPVISAVQLVTEEMGD
ncbi:type II secretion system F family protein, partial [Phenylobacterium sp.]|uniref:type II secretion system F family protein n=1 Tax=Phenylobacterium sp. TaxID=1871053 RepID=UPI00273732F9